ncbi:MAG: hypothetical protein EDM79_20605 [Chloroflexi bacterium]|nr:MAG: hypothetical protein EDM79_20605 [Chloroflexota bacterium]
MLQIGFSAPQRLIPASLDPTTQAPEVISQFGQILSNQSERWYAGTIEGLHRVSLEINSLSTDPTETVRLQFPIHMIVTKTQEPVDALNIISQMGGGGGGGESRAFADFELQDGEWDLYPDNPAPLDLRADALPFAPYDFTAPCKQPGIYKLEFSIPYTLFKADGSQTFASSYYIISLACPQSAALWLWNGNPNGQIEKAGNFIFENGKYIPQP